MHDLAAPSLATRGRVESSVNRMKK